jgi:hypothetical protein
MHTYQLQEQIMVQERGMGDAIVGQIRGWYAQVRPGFNKGSVVPYTLTKYLHKAFLALNFFQGMFS